MMLSGVDIRVAVEHHRLWLKAQEQGDTVAAMMLENEPRLMITPFHVEQINPNSYNCTLFPLLKIYDLTVHPGFLDAKADNPVTEVSIPPEGYVLRPGVLYLGRTNEYTETWNAVPQINGRSSIGRLGIAIHATAGFGDVGFKGTWTLEISVVHPVRIYPNMQICQLAYQTVSPSHENYKGRYQDQEAITTCQLFKTQM